MTQQRDSEAEEPPLIDDEIERAKREAENAVRQFDAVLDLIDSVERDERPFKLRVSAIQHLHRLAMEGMSRYAGNWRPGPVRIGQSKHVPPREHQVAALMEEMCDWVNDNWSTRTALELSAYVMWRLNWIHPFDDGNGRTSRAVAYLVLCARTKARLPGRITIPELIAQNKGPYYDALEKIDVSCSGEEFDLAPMTNLLEGYLAEQLMNAWEAATTHTDDEERKRKFH
ncbi:MAG TPA: Fic family protein [Allosphingosinicella sp.]|jgi:Fic family protein